MSVASLGYITINATDLGAWRHFGSEILGLMLNEEKSTDSTLYFRMDDEPSRLIIQQGDEDKLAAAGWEFANKTEFGAMVEKLRAAGLDVADGDSAGAEARNAPADPEDR